LAKLDQNSNWAKEWGDSRLVVIVRLGVSIQASRDNRRWDLILELRNCQKVVEAAVANNNWCSEMLVARNDNFLSAGVVSYQSERYSSAKSVSNV
jgi:hypothetical protein